MPLFDNLSTEKEPQTKISGPVSVNKFDAPIPGQSLTDTPGNAPWEHPPQFTDLNKALDHVYKTYMNRKTASKILTMLDKGVPAEHIARLTLFSGFQKGKWTPDLVLLMAKPTLGMVVAMGKAAGINKMKIASRKRGNEAAEFGAKMATNSMTKEQLMPVEEPAEKPMSFMERPNG